MHTIVAKPIKRTLIKMFGAVFLLDMSGDSLRSTRMLAVPFNVELVMEMTFRGAYAEFEHFDLS